MDLNELMKNPDQIKNLIQVLQALLPTEQSDLSEKTNTDTTEAPYSNRAIKTKGGGKRKKTQNSINRFESMSEFGMHKEDVAIDQMLSKSPPVARLREEAQPIKATCRICGKTEIVSPALIFDSINRYKCNNCSTQAG